MAISTAATLGLIGSAVSTGVAVYGQQQAASAAEDAAEYNAKIAENAAERAELENHETIKRQRAEKRRAMAEARARLATRGAALGEGTPVDLMEALDSRLETQIQDTARRAQLESRAQRQQAALSRYSGQQQGAALRMQSFGTAIGGAASLAGKYGRATYRTSGGKSSSTQL